LPLWGISLLTRALCCLFERDCVLWKQAMEFDPTMGWKPRPNLNVHCEFEDKIYGRFHVKTDLQGFRGKGKLSESDVVVFGDSYAFGYGVDDHKAFFSGRYTTLRIKAIAAPGYNMVQELILMRQLAPYLGGKLVVWFIYFGNDLYDNLVPNLQTYRRAFIRRVNGSENWEIVTSHLRPAKWPYNPKDHSNISKMMFAGSFGANALSQRVYSACEFLIREGRDICNNAGAQLVVMSVPATYQMGERQWRRTVSRYGDLKAFNRYLPDQKMTEICSKLDVPLVAARDHLIMRHHILDEGHWNERGHRRIAELLESVYHDYPLGNRGGVDRVPSQDTVPGELRQLGMQS
jgi:hypothetical protein